jgi:hypothetical protein
MSVITSRICTTCGRTFSHVYRDGWEIGSFVCPRCTAKVKVGDLIVIRPEVSLREMALTMWPSIKNREEFIMSKIQLLSELLWIPLKVLNISDREKFPDWVVAQFGREPNCLWFPPQYVMRMPGEAFKPKPKDVLDFEEI